MKYGLPTIDQLANYVGEHSFKMEFVSPSHLYWSFQIAMLINAAALQREAEAVNLKVYEYMESVLEHETGPIDKMEAYRVVIIVDY